MGKKTTYIHAENNNKILSSNEVRLYVPPEPEKMKVLIWGKELCNMVEWNDFLKCVEEKTEENNQLKLQIEEKDKEIEDMDKDLVFNANEIKRLIQEKKQLKQNQKELAIQELEKVKEWLEPKYFDYEQINYLTRIIDNQIRTLKNEEGR